MATTVHEPPQADQFPDHGNGGGGWKNLAPSGGNVRVAQEYSPPPASTGMWVVLFAITMMFAAFTSALIVRKGASLDWQSFRLPSVLYFNTFLLLVSSVTLEMARRRIAEYMSGAKTASRPGMWLWGTLALGLLFVAGQYVAWKQLAAQGLYLATNPSSSFFYVLTAMHAIHVLGGLGGLVYVISKLNRKTLSRNAVIAMARYWHFMGGLWVYLLVLLWVKL